MNRRGCALCPEERGRNRGDELAICTIEGEVGKEGCAPYNNFLSKSYFLHCFVFSPNLKINRRGCE